MTIARETVNNREVGAANRNNVVFAQGILAAPGVVRSPAGSAGLA